tara:strand:+ start:857 stop:1138 length:282 start_codon:yes stop_codon:yes gene_type:complete
MAVKFSYVTKDDVIATRITEGDYTNVVYRVGRIQFAEPDETGHRAMRFKYEIIDKPDDVEIKEDFMNIVGDIIVKQIEEKLEKGEMIYANGTD